MDDVEAHVAGPGDPEDRVEVGPVVVKEPTHFVDRRGQVGDVFFEQPEGVRVGEHDPRHVVIEVLTKRRRAYQPPTRPKGRSPSGSPQG